MNKITGAILSVLFLTSFNVNAGERTTLKNSPPLAEYVKQMANGRVLQDEYKSLLSTVHKINGDIEELWSDYTSIQSVYGVDWASKELQEKEFERYTGFKLGLSKEEFVSHLWNTDEGLKQVRTATITALGSQTFTGDVFAANKVLTKDEITEIIDIELLKIGLFGKPINKKHNISLAYIEKPDLLDHKIRLFGLLLSDYIDEEKLIKLASE